MVKVKRYSNNPILGPNHESDWEAKAVFNPSIAKKGKNYFMLYRAESSPKEWHGQEISLSTIGVAEGKEKDNFKNRRELIVPEKDWEMYGCEDPRVCKVDDTFYIFYTALSNYPPNAYGIKIGVALTKDFKTIDEKHLVTHFNSKAMGLFPRKINGQYVAVLTVDTDSPPAHVALAFFNKIEDLWDRKYWQNWRLAVDKYDLPLQLKREDHIEVGAAPVETDKGFLLVYSYIRNYLSSPKVFEIQAVLLDKNDPLKIIGKTQEPLLVPQEEYEKYGQIPNIVFPSGARVENNQLFIYYGAADTRCCMAQTNLKELLHEMTSWKKKHYYMGEIDDLKLERIKDNPIIKPKKENKWESKYTFNPGAIYLNNEVHILYRAMGEDDTSVIGYAKSKDGFKIDERLEEPIYTPREDFEVKKKPGFSGCEDPRIVKLGKYLYMCYTAFNGKDHWRIGMSKIKEKDFLNRNWEWSKPSLISPPGIGDKDASLFPQKIGGKYAIFHRIEPCIWLDFEEDLDFGKDDWVEGEIVMQPRTGKWDDKKIGIGGQPIWTEEGWIILYHGVSSRDDGYRLGAALLDLENPLQVLARIDYPIFEAEADYENEGFRANTVFGCGNIVIEGLVYVYYGAADSYVAVATVPLQNLLKELKKYQVGRFIY